VRVRESIRRIEREGWVVRLRNGGHLEAIAPTGRPGSHHLGDPLGLAVAAQPARSDAADTTAGAQDKADSQARPLEATTAAATASAATKAAGAGGRCRGTPGKAETIATPSGRPSRLL
jgi:hypothetical protein